MTRSKQEIRRTCENKSCGKLFNAEIADVKRGWARACSRACASVLRGAKRYKPFDNKAELINYALKRAILVDASAGSTEAKEAVVSMTRLLKKTAKITDSAAAK